MFQLELKKYQPCPPIHKFEESIRYSYKKTLQKLKLADNLVSKDDVSLLMDQFESQNELLRKSSSFVLDNSYQDDPNKTRDFLNSSSMINDSLLCDSDRYSICDSAHGDQGRNSILGGRKSSIMSNNNGFSDYKIRKGQEESNILKRYNTLGDDCDELNMSVNQ